MTSKVLNLNTDKAYIKHNNLIKNVEVYYSNNCHNVWSNKYFISNFNKAMEKRKENLINTFYTNTNKPSINFFKPEENIKEKEKEIYTSSSFHSNYYIYHRFKLKENFRDTLKLVKEKNDYLDYSIKESVNRRRQSKKKSRENFDWFSKLNKENKSNSIYRDYEKFISKKKPLWKIESISSSWKTRFNKMNFIELIRSCKVWEKFRQGSNREIYRTGVHLILLLTVIIFLGLMLKTMKSTIDFIKIFHTLKLLFILPTMLFMSLRLLKKKYFLIFFYISLVRILTIVYYFIKERLKYIFKIYFYKKKEEKYYINIKVMDIINITRKILFTIDYTIVYIYKESRIRLFIWRYCSYWYSNFRFGLNYYFLGYYKDPFFDWTTWIEIAIFKTLRGHARVTNLYELFRKARSDYLDNLKIKASLIPSRIYKKLVDKINDFSFWLKFIYYNKSVIFWNFTGLFNEIEKHYDYNFNCYVIKNKVLFKTLTRLEIIIVYLSFYISMLKLYWPRVTDILTRYPSEKPSQLTIELFKKKLLNNK